ncbi:MAG: TatD family hydrolase [Gemmatimonadaceae bacterium]|nr:TatD family hydrolase [Gemmatimonadaceae bacterium]
MRRAPPRRTPCAPRRGRRWARAEPPLTAFVDSHVHLADPAFDADRDDVIERARLTGARALVCIGESLETARRAAEIAARYPGFVYHTAGVHPYDAGRFDAAHDLPAIRGEVARGAVAIGECGLDYTYEAPRDRQHEAFSAQLALGGELDKPVVVHTREAEDATRTLVVEAGRAGVRGVLHCYTGSAALATAALDVGWYVSFSGIVTFRKWTDDALLRLVPDDRLLVESDAPYLAPVPQRGKRNESAWVTFTVARVAAARGTDAASLGARTAENARRLFGLA